MAGIIRDFAKAKMNKDVDERLLPNGEYRDALNVQPIFAGSGSAGALQNIRGNTKLNTIVDETSYTFSESNVCVGAISNPATDKAYYLVNARDETSLVKKDYILEHDVISKKLAFIFVDIYEASVTMPIGGSFSTFNAGSSPLRAGMQCVVNNVQHVVLEITSSGDVTLSGSITAAAGDTVVFTHAPVLEFPRSGTITGLNVLDDTLFWTDNSTEPKRINISQSKAGTGGPLVEGNHADAHTKFTRIATGSIDLLEVPTFPYGGAEYPKYISLEDITVIRKAPTQALVLEASSTADNRSVSTSGTITAAALYSEVNPVGSTISGLTFSSPVDFREGDFVTFTQVGSDNGDYDIRALVIESPYTETDPGANSGHSFEVTSISPDLLSSQSTWYVELDAGEAFLEDKFVRFSHRYKYQNGEYSTFAPWTGVAFIPGVYRYHAKDGYNQGMANRMRSLTLKNYIPENIPKGVTEIDLLYKETNNPTVYTVKTVKISEPEYKLTTDMVHAVVASNQLLRPWDNVPRTALAQEVSANRIMYGNYKQGYDLPQDPILSVGSVSSSASVTAEGVPSLKTLREYQVGVVFSDRYGRETPILTSEGSSVKVPITMSAKANKLRVGISKTSTIPSWATHYSFYVKEPTVEYYTLSMDRWYNAADGNIWMSFPSSERNKLSEETFLRLKKAHGNNIPVQAETKYRVLAIENEAPEFIKTLYKGIGSVENNEGSSDNIGTSEGGYPLPGTRTLSIAAGPMDLGEGFGGKWWRLKVYNTANANEFSQVYNVDKVSMSNDRYVFHLSGAFTNDVSFTSLDGTWDGRINSEANGYAGVQLFEGEPKSRPEFDGRFFVKIAKSLDVETYITSFENNDSVVFNSMEIAYVNNDAYTTNSLFHKPHLKSALEAEGLTTTVNPTENTGHSPPYAWDSSGSFVDISSNSIDTVNGSDGASFWHGMKGKFFIDRCSAYSWSGRTSCYPGSYFGEAAFSDGYWWESSDSNNCAQTVLPPLDSYAGGIFSFSLDENSIYPQETLTNVIYYPDRGGGLPSRGLWNIGNSGYMDLAYTGVTGNSTWGLRVADDPEALEAWTFIEKMYIPGTKFRFGADPDSTIYTVQTYLDLLNPGNQFNQEVYYLNGNGNNTWPPDYTWYKHGHYGIRNTQVSSAEEAWEPFNLRQRWTVKVSPAFGSGPSGYSPTTGTTNFSDGITQVRALHHDGTNLDVIQLLTPTEIDDDGNDISGGYVGNPAVWETEPKESVDIDIYYQASDIIALRPTDSAAEDYIPTGSTFTNNGNIITVTGWVNGKLQLDNALTTPTTTATEVTTPNGRLMETGLVGAVGALEVSPGDMAAFRKHTLSWGNCWSFGNGVESDRVRDDYNAPQMDNGVKASTVIASQYSAEHRQNGVIWSGRYNSTSGVNETNQFIMAEAITKDVNPTNGSIQRLLTRDNALVILCEDKILRAVTDKDALYNADGNPQLIASNRTVGDAVAYKGDWGISKNPESMAVSAKGVYFTDASRGAVVELAANGLIPISEAGMASYFLGLKTGTMPLTQISGSFDDKKGEYNLTTKSPPIRTLSFNEKGGGWTSFKSFIPQVGVSLNNEYYTFSKGHIWHHHSNDICNNFYDEQFESTVDTVFSDATPSVMSLGAISYTGTKARTTSFQDETVDFLTGNYGDAGGGISQLMTGDLEYVNLSDVEGWYVKSINTDLQSGGEVEFKEKEGKWYGVPVGDSGGEVKLSELSTQGLGVAAASYSGIASGVVTVTFTDNQND